MVWLVRKPPFGVPSAAGSNTMNIIRLSAMAALGFASLSGNALAQTNLPPLQSQSLPPPTGSQTVQPIVVPQPQLPPAASAFTSCTINSDTQAMNCQNTCVVVGPV